MARRDFGIGPRTKDDGQLAFNSIHNAANVLDGSVLDDQLEQGLSVEASRSVSANNSANAVSTSPSFTRFPCVELIAVCMAVSVQNYTILSSSVLGH